MRNRFKPTLSSSRSSSRSGTSLNENAGEDVSSSRSSANSKDKETAPRANKGKSSETVPEAVATNEQGQDETTQLKTPSTSSTSVAGSSRRSRIKPAVTPVARARPKNRNKDQTTTGAQHASADKRESFSHGQKTSHINDKQLLSSEEERQEADSSTEELSKSPSLKERSKQIKSRSSAASSPSASNTELRLQPLPQVPVIKPSQAQNKNTNCDNTVMQSNDTGTPQALVRRKRVLPNLGSASRRRHSSVSKENVEKITDIPEVRHEEIVTTAKDLEHIDEQSPTECSASRKTRLQSLFEEENTVNHGIPPATLLEIHEKKDLEEDEEDNKKKGVKRKRGGRRHKMEEPSDPSQMTMQHLIYFNPKTNPMASSMAGKKKKPDGKSKRKKGNDKTSQQNESTEETDAVNNPSSVSPARTDPPQNNSETNIDEGDTDSTAVAPRVMLDADGNIIVDEESLLIPKTPEKTLDDREIVYEDADKVNVGAYLKHRKVERWSLEETKKFYMALSQVGTDFSLMGPLFPSRIRRELKAKFKREEKLHRGLVDKALRVRNPIDVELFTPKVDGEEIDDDLASIDDDIVTQPT